MTRYHGQTEQGNVSSSFNPWAGRGRARAAAPFKRKLLVETIEQRVLMDADPLSVATVAGSIDAAGEIDRYTFHLDSNARIALDSLTQNGNLNWTLSGPAGLVVNRAYFSALSSTNASYAPLELGAGDYKLDVAANGASTGAYSLRLLDLARATTIALDTPVSGNFAQSGETQAFGFDAQAGDQLFLTWQQHPDAYLRIYDPWGQQVNANYGTGQYYDSAVPRLAFSGRYTVLLDASGGVAAGAGFGFTLHRSVAPVQNLGTWSGAALAVDATLAAPGDRAVFTFTLDGARSVLLDSLTANDSLMVSLTGPDGQVYDSFGQAVSNRGLSNYADHSYYGTGRLDLRAGQYTLVVSGSGSVAGPAALRLVDIGAAPLIAKGTVVSAELAPGNSLQAFSFDAAAGDKIDIDVISSAGGSPSYQLIDPYGRKVTWAWNFYDLTSVALPASGRYTLVVSGETGRSAPTQFSFQLADRGNTPPAPLPAGAPLTLGETVEGSIAANDSTVWNFTLAETTTVYVDPLSQNQGYYTASWSLRGPRGTEVNGQTWGGYQYYGWDDGARMLTLPAGDYALTVSSTLAMPNLKLRVFDVDTAAAPALPNAFVSGQLDPGSAATAYRFDAQAGQRLYFETTGNANYLRYRLIGPSGREEISARSWGDWEGTLAAGGTYTLLVEGSNSRGAAPLDYKFRLSMPDDGDAVYDPAASTGTGPAWTMDGAAPAVFFDSRSEIRVEPSADLNLAHDASFQVRVRVDSFEQDWQTIVFKGGDVNDINQRTYTLWVNAAGYLHLTTTDAAGQMDASSAPGSVKAGQWYDVAGVIDRTSGEMLLYVDGVLAARTALRSGYGDARVRDTPLYLGNAPAGGQYYANHELIGAIGEFRLWDRALSGAEVGSLLGAAPDAADSHLKLWLKLDEGAGAALADSSQSGLHAAIHNRFDGMAGVVAGNLALPGQHDVYHLSLPEQTSFYIDSLAPYTRYYGGSMNLSINGPRTAISENLTWFNNRMITLAAGDYTFTVDGIGSSTGGYAFRLINQAAAHDVAFGEAVSGSLRPGDTAQLYQFEASAGESVYLQRLGSSGFNPAWRLVDPFGREVFGRTGMASRDPSVLAYSGTYTLIVDGDYSNYGQAAEFGFRVDRIVQPAAIDFDIADGSDAGVARSGGRAHFGAVQVSDLQYLEFADSAATDATGTVTLQVGFRVDDWSVGGWIPLLAKTTPDSQRQFGVYVNNNGRIHVGSNPDFGGAYNSVETANGLVAAGGWQDLAVVYDRASSQLRIVLNGVAVAQGYLSPSSAIDLAEPMRIGYTPEGAAYHGHRVTVDQLAIWNRALTTQAAGVPAAELAGTEEGLVALYRFDEAEGGTVANALGGGGDGSVVRMAARVNALVTGRLDQPGQTRTFTFTLAEPKQLYFDSLTRRTDLRWTLSGAGMSDGDSFYYGDANYGRNLLKLAAGSYTVKVDGDGDATGDFMFRLLDVAAADDIALDQVVAGRLDPGSASRIYRFDAAAGQRVYFDQLSHTGYTPEWRLLDPAGNPVFGINWFGDQDATTLQRSGSYTLIVEDYTAVGGPDQVRDFSFALRSVTDGGAALDIGSRLLLPEAWTDGPFAGGAALELSRGQQVVVAPDPALALSGDLTLEAMVRVDDLNGDWMPLVSYGAAGLQGYGVSVGYGGQLLFESNAGGEAWSFATEGRVIEAGAWQRVSVAVDRANGSASIYVDGQEVATRYVGAGEQGGAAMAGAALRVGGTVLNRPGLAGAVADVRLWNTALSAALIDARRGVLLDGTEAGLVLNLKMDEGAGRALADSGPLDLDGQLGSVNGNLSGTVAEGVIGRAGERMIYTIAPDADTRLLFDSLSGDSRFTWTLRDDSGNPVVDLHGQTLSNRNMRSSDNFSRVDLVLRAGHTYRLEVDAAGDATGSFAFRLAAPGDAQLIGYDMPVDATVYPGNAAALFAFDAEAGDQVQLDHLAHTSLDWTNWRLYSPSGRELYNYYFADWGEGAVMTLAEAGRYMLVLDPPVDGRGAANYQFQVKLAGHVELPAPPASTALSFADGVAEISGIHADINQEQFYSFTLDQPKRIYVDTLNNTNTVYTQWRVTGPQGEVASRWAHDTDGLNARSFYELAAGTYTFGAKVPYSWALGEYRFRLIDIGAAAAPIGMGVAVSGSLTPANGTAFYSFTGAAGERLFVANNASSNMGNAYWRVLDAQTLAVVGEGYYGNGLDNVTLARDGNYLLALEGYYGTTGNASYSFTAYRSADSTHALTLGSRTEAGLAQPGDTQRYTFSMAQAGKLWFDSLSGRSDIRWRVLDHDGIAVFGDRGTLDYGWDNNTSRFDLAAGDYTLVIDGVGSASGAFAFRLLDLADATPITPGTAASGQLAPANATAMFSFQAQAGERFFFDVLSRSSGNTYWRLLDPYGHNVFYGEGLGDHGTTAMPYTGTYTVVVEGYPHDVDFGYGNVNFSFNVQPVLDQAPVPLDIGALPGPNLQVLELAVAGADGSVHSGGDLVVSWTSANTGVRDVDTAFQERVVVRNAAGETLVNQLVSYDRASSGPIAAGAGAARSATVRLPAGARGAGPLTVSVFTDVANAVREQGATGENDNSAQIAVESVLLTYPDLTVSGVALAPASNLAAGDAVTVSWRVANGGGLATSGGWSDHVVVRNLSTGEIVLDQTSRIEGGAAVIQAGDGVERQMVFNWPSGRKAAGQFQVTVTTDALGEVAEYNAADTAEANNAASISFTSAPDLSIDGLQVLTATPVSGGEVQLAWTVHNGGNAPTPAGWYDRITAVNLDTGMALLNLEVSYAPAAPLAAGASASRNFTLRLPDSAAAVGRIRFTVTADQNAAGAGTLPETNEDNNSAFTEASAIRRLAPNLVVTDFSSPASHRSGDAAAFGWTVQNAGNAGSGATSWYDRIVMSQDAVIGNGDDVTIASVLHNGALDAGASYSVSTNLLVPGGYDGNYRFALVTDVLGQVAEPDAEGDNASAARAVLLTAYHADLVPALLSVPAAASGGSAVPVSWRVTNQGDATTNSTWWLDHLWLSLDGTVGAGSGAIDLGTFGHGGTLAVGASYDMTQNVVMPNGVTGNYKLVLQTNYNGYVYESRFSGNNTVVSAGTIALTAAPAIDLRVENVSGPATAQPGQRQTVSWEIANTGAGTAAAPWTDHVYLSRDGSMTGAVYLTSLAHDAPLAGGARVQANAQFWMPDVGDGAWHVVVLTDVYGQVFETGAADAESGNRGVAGITQLGHPDVRASAIAVADGATAGRASSVTWTTRNDGSAAVLPGWFEKVFLSSDATLDGGDLLLGNFAVDTELGAGATLARSASLMLPSTIAAGSWRIIVQSDTTNALYELAGENNNVAASAVVAVAAAPLPNLAPANVAGPASMRPGDTVTVSWDELNLLAEPASGSWATQVFLSNDAVLGADQLVATVSTTGTVAGNGSVARSAQVSLPTTLAPGNWRFVVKVDSGNGVAERDEQDNSAIAAADSFVSPALRLNLQAGSVAEAAGATSATVQRNGDLSQALTIALTSSDAGEAAVPATVTIPAGQAAVTFIISLPADGIVDGVQAVQIGVSAPGLLGDSRTLNVANSDVPALTLNSVLAVQEGQGSVHMTVSRNTDGSAGAQLVRLSSNNTGVLRVPGTVIIPAGAASVSFDATLLDDAEVWGTRNVRVNAAADGYLGHSVNLAVADDELPELSLVFSAAQVAEGAGANAVGVTLRRDRPGTYDLVFNIASDNRDLLGVPTRVVIAAGDTEVHFNASTVDDGDVNPSRTVGVRATMMAPNGTKLEQNAASATIVVTDDDGPTLTVTLDAESMSELGSPITGTVRRNTGTSGDLVVTLASSDTSEATVAATVTILDGQDSATFSVAPVSDGLPDGRQTATIRASAAGYNGGAAGVAVTDGDLPDLVVTGIGQPAGGIASGRIDISWTVGNIGRSEAAGGFRDRVYLSRDGVLSAADRLMAAVIHTAPLAQGASYTQTASIQLPAETGDYRIIIVTDALGSLPEGSERNNVSAGAVPIIVRAPITASVHTDVTRMAVGAEANSTVVPLTGSAVDAVTGAAAAGQPVKVMIRVGAIERLLDATTDEAGNFTIDFKPLPNEVGQFEIGAGYAGDTSFAVQDSFELIGMSASVPYIRAMGTNETALEGSFILKNLSGAALSGLSAAVDGLAPNFQFDVVGLGTDLAGDGSVTVHWRLTGHGVSDTLATSRGMLVLTTAEGASERVVLDLACIPQTPKLVATPGFLARGMLRGAQTLVSFEVFNQGAADTGEVRVDLPEFPWLKLVSPAVIANIAAGASATVTVALTPDEATPLIRFDGTIALNAKLGGLSMPFQFRAVSEAKGDMRVSVEDQFTYYAEGAPKLAGATVTLTDPYTYQVVATAVTGESGEVLLSGIAEGKYIMTVNADKHGSYRATKTISAGTTTDQTVFLDRQLVSYSWNVVPVDVQDRYKIVLESTFETEVPVPVITVDALKMPVILPGVTSTTTLTVTNHGLIQAENVEIRVPIDDLFEIVALTPMIDILPAMSSVEVPITIRLRDGVTPAQLSAASMAGNGVSPEGWGSAIVKCLGIDTAYQLRCGADGRWYTESTSIKPVLCAMDIGEAGAGQLLSYIGDDFNLLDLGCDALDLLLACFDADDCLSFFINAACGAIVGGVMGGPAGAAAGAAGALDDLLACMCQVLGPIGGGTTPTPPPTGGGGGGWGWYPYGGGYGGGGGWTYDIQYVNCRGEPVSALEQERADLGLEAAMASGAVGADAAALVAAHNAERAGLLAAAVADGDGVLDAEEAGICAQVRIRMEQEAVLTRTAFQGTLEVINGNSGVPLTGVQLVLDIRDQNGNAVNNLFATRDPLLTGLTAIDGTGVLAGGASGRAQYLFIPTVDAARDQPARYTIGGTLSYIEGGQKITVPLLPAQITVFPEARLNLHYFQQRDVIGDDPFTKEVVEPSEEFALGLLVYNDGKGDARNLSITSAQPKIIENEKGLLIDFKIVGTQVGAESMAPTLTANLGNIAAGQAQVAQWLMTSTLQGKFIDYTASFEHIDGMGDQRLSLIESVNIHELIRSVKANGGDAPDFLVNDDPDSEHAPDRLYLNDGSQHVVRAIANASAAGSVAPGALAVAISADSQAGWGYLKIADPGVGYVLDRIVRSDGKVLNLGREVWRTSRSFPESIPGAVRENLLHFIDKDSTGQYTAYYKIDDAVAPRLVEIVAVSPDPASAPVDTIDVRFSEELDPASFTVADLVLAREGEPGVNLLDGATGITVTALGSGAYRIGGLAAFTASGDLYRLTVNAAGVADHAGNAGSGVLTETWGVGEIGPYVLSMAAGPAARNSALDTVDITFSTALDAASFSADDLRLERDGVVQSLAGAALSLTQLAGNQYRVGGLAPLTGAPGAYTLTLTGAGLLSSGGAAGLGSQAVGWRMDTVAPQVIDVVDLIDQIRKTVVLALDVELSEQVDLASFDYRDVVLTRSTGGVTSANLIDARTKVEHVTGNTYRISGFNWVSGLEGSYRFSINGEGLADLAGNAGAGSASTGWLMDFHDPAAATNLAVSPDSGSDGADGVINTLRFTLTGNVGEAGLAVRVSDRTSGNEIGYATVTGNTFSIPVAFDAAGRHELRVRSVDAAGNLADSFVVVFVDQVRPTMAAPVLARDAQGNVDSITFNFSEALDPASVTLDAFGLARGGGANLLGGAVLARASATQYVLSGLAGLTAPAGSYQLAVDLTRLRDLAGNAGAAVAQTSFAGALASTGAVSGAVYDDIDGTGTREADELAQGGWTVFDDLDGDGQFDSGEASAITDAAGRYSLEGLALGQHRITVLLPAGWTITPAPVAQVTLGAEAPTVTRNFGAFALAGLSGAVFDDANANGVRDAGEAGLAGRQVLLDLNGNGAADAGEAVATTDADGRYALAGLRPGSARVVLFAGDGWLALQNPGMYAPKSGEAATRDLAAVHPGAIMGMKYEDSDGNGQFDEGELGVAGWRVFLDDNGNDALDIGERYTFTDANGIYAFTDLRPGSYRVVEEVRTGWIQTAPGSLEAGSGSQQGIDVQLSLPGMIADIEEQQLIDYLTGTGANFNCGCGTFVLEKYTTGQAAGHFTKLDTITDPMLANLTGKGVRVAVIDTGINTSSSFFGPDANGDGVADRIAYQYDFGDGDADASDMLGHGTNVAGVIAGADAQYGGVATEADLVVLKVFDANNVGYMSTLKRALEWLDANAEAYGIGVVNMSLGDGGNWGDAISRYGMADLFQRLAAKGLVMVAASGNNYFQGGGALGVAYPGADPAVLSVGAMWAGNFGGPWRFASGATDYTTAFGRIASFTQRDPDQIDVMAPGARFTSAGLNGGLSTMQGTSQAAAFMSGAAALVQQAAKSLMGRYLNTGEFAALLDLYTYRAVDGDDESDNVANSGAAYNKLDIPKLLQGLKTYAAGGALPGGGAGGEDAPDLPLTAYSARTATVAAGQTLGGQNFGNFKLGQVSGQLFGDANRDGAQQAGEAGLAGVTVFLDADDDGVLDEGETRTSTDAAGHFAFGALGPGMANVRAIAPDGRQATGAAVQRIKVTSGLDLATLRFGYADPAPTLVAADDAAALIEDASVTIDVLANDRGGAAAGLVLAVEGDGPAHGSVQVVGGQFVYTPHANYFGADSFRYTVSAPGGATSSAAVSITVAPVNDAPLLAPVASQSIAEGDTLVLQLAGSDPDAGDTLRYSLAEAPAGATIDAVTGELRWTATAFAGMAQLTVRVTDGADAFAEQSFSVEVRLGKLVATSFAAQPWGFAIRFNDVVDQSQFNLYGGSPDLQVRGARVGAVAGSVLFDADGKGLQFVRTGATFEADQYTVRLKSGPAALTSGARGDLDGDGDGSAGGDFVTGFTAVAAPPVRLRLPDFARAAGQAVRVPNTGTGMPVTLVTNGTASSLTMRLMVDPALMTVSAVNAGSGLPAGATLQVQAIAGGFLVQIQSNVPIAAGSRQILNVVASMNGQAQAGSAGMLRLEDVTVNGVAAPDAGDAGVVYVGNTGDIDRNGVYDNNDVNKLQRLVVKLDTYIAGADDIDALVIGDVDADGAITSRDVAAVQARTKAASTPMIPAVVAPAAMEPASTTMAVAGPAPVAAKAPATGAAGASTLNLAGSLGNFSVKAAPAPAAGTVSAQVALKVVPSVKSEGVAA